MIDVYVELTNIEWENDCDGEIAYDNGTSRSFEMTMFESENLDNKIKEHLHETIGHRPRSWYLYELSVVGER